MAVDARSQRTMRSPEFLHFDTPSPKVKCAEDHGGAGGSADGELEGFELLELVADLGGLLEVEVVGRGVHLLLELVDGAAQIVEAVDLVLRRLFRGRDR